jgi:hypothetical protein
MISSTSTTAGAGAGHGTTATAAASAAAAATSCVVCGTVPSSVSLTRCETCFTPYVGRVAATAAAAPVAGGGVATRPPSSAAADATITAKILAWQATEAAVAVADAAVAQQKQAEDLIVAAAASEQEEHESIAAAAVAVLAEAFSGQKQKTAAAVLGEHQKTVAALEAAAVLERQKQRAAWTVRDAIEIQQKQAAVERRGNDITTASLPISYCAGCGLVFTSASLGNCVECCTPLLKGRVEGRVSTAPALSVGAGDGHVEVFSSELVPVLLSQRYFKMYSSPIKQVLLGAAVAVGVHTRTPDTAAAAAVGVHTRTPDTAAAAAGGVHTRTWAAVAAAAAGVHTRTSAGGVHTRAAAAAGGGGIVTGNPDGAAAAAAGDHTRIPGGGVLTSRPPPGITNSGVMCYGNILLQSFMSFLPRDDNGYTSLLRIEGRQVVGTEPLVVVDALQLMINQLRSGVGGGTNAIDSRDTYEQLKKVWPVLFSGIKQQDPHEALVKLLDRMELEGQGLLGGGPHTSSEVSLIRLG